MTNIDKQVAVLDEEFKRIWESEPKEVQILKKMVGAFDLTGPLLLYVESETRELMDYLWIVQTMMREGRLSEEVGKKMFQEILRFKAGKFINWYRIHHTAKLMQDSADALEAARSRDETLKLVDALSRYMNKWNYWVDYSIPWADIGFVYDAALGKH